MDALHVERARVLSQVLANVQHGFVAALAAASHIAKLVRSGFIGTAGLSWHTFLACSLSQRFRPTWHVCSYRFSVVVGSVASVGAAMLRSEWPAGPCASAAVVGSALASSLCPMLSACLLGLGLPSRSPQLQCDFSVRSCSHSDPGSGAVLKQPSPSLFLRPSLFTLPQLREQARAEWRMGERRMGEWRRAIRLGAFGRQGQHNRRRRAQGGGTVSSAHSLCSRYRSLPSSRVLWQPLHVAERPFESVSRPLKIVAGRCSRAASAE